MPKTLYYSFRTFPYLLDLERAVGPVFIFGPLKRDLGHFLRLIEEEKPNYIVGIARATQSRYETEAVNHFHRSRIHQGGPESYSLTPTTKIWPNYPIPVATQPTTSFCNWTMYQIQRHLSKNHSSGAMRSELAFLHITSKDFYNLLEILATP